MTLLTPSASARNPWILSVGIVFAGAAVLGAALLVVAGIKAAGDPGFGDSGVYSLLYWGRFFVITGMMTLILWWAVRAVIRQRVTRASR
jgi:hypothetical protein